MSKYQIDTAVDVHGHSPARAGGSDKAFGLVFGGFFTIVGLHPLINGSPPRYWAMLLAALFVLAALLWPGLLSPLNKVWIKFGVVLNHVISPVALLITYCLAIVPTGLLLRAVGKDPLKLRLDPEATTYWIQRTPPGRADEQMKRQF